MSTNRLLLYLNSGCPCGRAQHVVDQWESVAADIESADPDLLQFHTPSISTVMEGDEIRMEYWLLCELQPVTDLLHAHEQVSIELRRIANQMQAVADKLDFGLGVF